MPTNANCNEVSNLFLFVVCLGEMMKKGVRDWDLNCSIITWGKLIDFSHLFRPLFHFGALRNLRACWISSFAN